MTTVEIRASTAYNVIIGQNLIANIGAYIASINAPCKCAIVSDDNVWPLYGETVSSSLVSADFQVVHYVFPAGEQSKSTKTYVDILNFLAENNITRSDMIIAFGGGVTGDMAGFAASTFLRGIKYIQVPTSLLAMVDSSVGGKTAIDLPAGKNLAGAFYQPSLVLCDIDALNTLPEETFIDGCAEIIKYAVLFSPELFEHLETYGLNFDREYVITSCVKMKRDVVMQDEFDLGERQLLNLGHTFGHCIEVESNFSITHGKAVAMGMCIAVKSGIVLGLTEANMHDKVHYILNKFNLPTKTDYSPDILAHHALSDKKRTGGTVNLIFPCTVGYCIRKKIPVDQIYSIIKSGL